MGPIASWATERKEVMGKQDGLDGWMEGGLQQGPLQTQAEVTVLDEEEGFLPAWPVHLVLATCTAHRDLPACLGKPRGRVQKGGVDWCLDKVREEAALKEEFLQVQGQD